MAHSDRDVKPTLTEKMHAVILAFVDSHPRVGWYIAALTTLNTILSILGLFHH